MNREATPTGIERTEQRRLRIAWSDGELREYSAAELRKACPCATCRETAQAPDQPADPLAVIPIAETKPVEVTGMRPVGSYAYGIEFSDGHSTGLFTFRRLRELGVAVGPESPSSGEG